MTDFIQGRFARRATRSGQKKQQKILTLEYTHLPPMLLLATLRTTSLALNWTFGRFPPSGTSELEQRYAEPALWHIEWLYMALQKPELSRKQIGTTYRGLQGLAHMLTRIQTEGT